MKEYILVTGGLGYIGSHIVKKLLEDNYKVIVIDLKKDKHNYHSEYTLDKRLLIYTFDLRNHVSELSLLLKYHSVWGVIHCAAFKSVPQSVTEPLMYYQNNLISMMNILEWMKSNNIYNFVYSSSATVYGGSNTFKENNYWNGGPPNNPYGITKLMGELILKDLSKSDSQWKIISLRYFNPGMSHLDVEQGDSGLFTAIDRVLKGKVEYLKVFGDDYDTPDGSCIRDYIHIDDLVDGHIAALMKLYDENGNLQYEDINLGQGIGHSTIEVAETLKDVVNNCDKDINFDYKIVERREGDDVISVANCEKAKTVLGWESKKTLYDICFEIVNK
jgi:UDP-glucose 4-epimerase